MMKPISREKLLEIIDELGDAIQASYQSAKATAKFGTRLVYVVAGIAMVVGVSALMASVFVNWLESLQLPDGDELSIAKMFAGGASLVLLVATWERLWLTGRKIVLYLRNAEPFDLYDEAISSTSQLFLVLVAVLAFVSEVETPEVVQGSFNWDVVYITEKPPETETLATFPLVFKNAKFEKEGFLSLRSEGIDLNAVHKTQLRQLLNAFVPCAQGYKSLPVKLEIAGYSSTRYFYDFYDNPMEASPTLNVYAANLRTESVLNFINAYLGDLVVNHSFEITPVYWEKPEQMQRPYYDDEQWFGSQEQELLNRAVHIRLRHAGGCQVREAMAFAVKR